MRFLTPRWVGFLTVVACSLAAGRASVQACQTDAECGCDGSAICSAGACVPAFTLPVFPVGPPTASAYTTPMIAVMDHAGGFYTGCCDTHIIAFSGERADRDADAVLCPAPPVFPTCLFTSCLCGYDAADGSDFVVNGRYVGVVGPSHLQYDGHAGYDYEASTGTALVATRDGILCKAVGDSVNGTLGAPTAWDGFHTFYVDHGVVAGAGWSSWYLHATDLAGTALDGRGLATLVPGECAPVAGGQLVATAGNTGTAIPHLHFDVRRSDPLAGPEASSAKIIDPYGWRGTDPDPWSVPGANPQAATQGPALWRGCGNGRVECGEACDDGNRRDGDCCSAMCGAESTGAPCGGSANPCSDERCDGAGYCRETALPRPACRVPTTTGGARLDVRSPDAAVKRRWQWSWTHGAATNAAEFGMPAATERYRLCAFAGAPTATLVFGAALPAGGTCPEGGASCWTAKGTPPGSRGWRYRDREATPDGIEQAVLQPGADGKAKISMKGKGANLALPTLPLGLPLRVQLWAESGACWEAAYATSGVQRNDGGRFQARSQ